MIAGNYEIYLWFRPAILDFEFTGRIKYSNYQNHKNVVSFEVTYMETSIKIKNTLFGNRKFTSHDKITRWVSDGSFKFVELPVETIVDCGIIKPKRQYGTGAEHIKFTARNR